MSSKKRKTFAAALSLAGTVLSVVPCFGLVFPGSNQELPSVPAVQAVAVETGQGQDHAGIDWVSIPGGTFMMGADIEGDARPVHLVTVRPFEMAKTPVTLRQYQACINAGRCTPVDESACMTSKFRVDLDQPIVCVDWEQARQFAQWAGGRLPTEAEWEYAAKSAGQPVPYPWGSEEPTTCQWAVMRGCGAATKPACSVPQGNTRQGLCDMAGNVWEWTEDMYHSSYDGAPSDGGAWDYPAGANRVVRGGSWREGAEYLRADSRLWAPADTADRALGLRPVRAGR